MRRDRKAKSPWQRHQKTKHRYSEAYYQWFRAVVAYGAGSPQAIENDRHCRRQHGVKIVQSEY